MRCHLTAVPLQPNSRAKQLQQQQQQQQQQNAETLGFLTKRAKRHPPTAHTQKNDHANRPTCHQYQMNITHFHKQKITPNLNTAFHFPASVLTILVPVPMEKGALDQEGQHTCFQGTSILKLKEAPNSDGPVFCSKFPCLRNARFVADGGTCLGHATLQKSGRSCIANHVMHAATEYVFIVIESRGGLERSPTPNEHNDWTNE